jgi:hypothetical protein
MDGDTDGIVVGAVEGFIVGSAVSLQTKPLGCSVLGIGVTGLMAPG